MQCKFYHFKIQTLGIWFKDTAKAFDDFLNKPKKCMNVFCYVKVCIF